MFCVLQECDQVHIDDVSSDDNGQDLRYSVTALSFLVSYAKLKSMSKQQWLTYSFFAFTPVRITSAPTVSMQQRPVPTYVWPQACGEAWTG